MVGIQHVNQDFIDLFIPSIHDAQTIFTQELALEFIASFTKNKTIYLEGKLCLIFRFFCRKIKFFFHYIL